MKEITLVSLQESFPGNGNTAVSDDAKAFSNQERVCSATQQEHEILKKAMGIISRSDL